MLYNFLILCLSVFRIANLLIDERGPYRILQKFRELIGIWDFEAPDGELIREIKEDNELGQLFNCIWCLSPYIATIAILIPERIRYIVLLPFAISTVVIIIKEKILNAM